VQRKATPVLGIVVNILRFFREVASVNRGEYCISRCVAMATSSGRRD